jgi:ABC-type antimicrobial peptide transport system permease subunit
MPQPVAEEARLRPMLEDVTQDVKTPLVVLLCAVGCMLLIACLNVSNLLVARSAARRKELAVRGALGGSRLTLIGEQMAESLLICIAGGTLGFCFLSLATRWLADHWNDLPAPRRFTWMEPCWLCASAWFFLRRCLRACSRLSPPPARASSPALQESSRSIGGSLSRATLRKTLLTVEIALTVILLVSAGLLFKSFLHLRTSI